MKKASFLFTVWVIGFILLSFTSLNAQGIEHQWNTFLGSGNSEYGLSIALDSLGNSYVTGYGYFSWGSPINAYSGGGDAYVACLDSNGNLLWNTFLGSTSSDWGQGIVLDSSGNIYVTGHSGTTWGTPINAHSGGSDVFLACLNSSGNLIWNTFLGSALADSGDAIILDSSGNFYVTGHSGATWGSPVNAHSGNDDVFVAVLDSSGNLLWNTFLGSTSADIGYGIALDSSGNVYVTGYSDATWGSPVNAHSGGNEDVFVARLDSSGNLLWNTFLGSTSADIGYGIALDSSGNVYVTGYSDATWGSPVNAHSGNEDAFVARLDSSGNQLWNTFLGSASSDYCHSIALDSSGNIYVTGNCFATWGTPINAYSGDNDAYVACLNSSGNLLWNTFLGSASIDYGRSIALDSSGNIYVTGYSNASWGSPVNAHSGDTDVFVAKISLFPVSDIAANGSDGPISITQADSLHIRVSLNSNGLTTNADYWLAYRGPSGWVHFNNDTKKWEAGLGVTHQGPLMDLSNKKVFQSKLTPGNYTFYFGVDMVMDGKVTKSSLYKDEVKVTVTQ